LSRFPSFPFTLIKHRSTRLVLDVAADQALLDTKGQGSGDVLLESGKVVGVNLLGETESGVNNVTGGVDEEVLGDGRSTGVLGVEASHTDGGVAVVVLLPVDATHGEGGTLEERQFGALFGGEAVLQNEAGGDVAVSNNREELGGVWVDVGSVETTGLKEDTCGGDAQSSQEGEVLAVGQVYLAAEGDAGVWCWRVGGRVEVELERQGSCLNFGGDLSEAVNAAVLGEELGDGARGGFWVGGRAGVAEKAGGGSGRVGPGTTLPVAGAIAIRWRGRGGRGSSSVVAGSHGVITGGRAGSPCRSHWGGGGGGSESSNEKRSRMHPD